MSLETNRARPIGLAGEKPMPIWQICLIGGAFGSANGWMKLHQVLAGKPGAVRRTPLPRDHMYRPVTVPACDGWLARSRSAMIRLDLCQ